MTTSMRMRPVWRRRQRRVYMQDPLEPPTAEDVEDAFRVLADDDNRRFAPALFAEATRIIQEMEA